MYKLLLIPFPLTALCNRTKPAILASVVPPPGEKMTGLTFVAPHEPDYTPQGKPGKRLFADGIWI